MKSFMRKMLSIFVASALCCGLVPGLAMAQQAGGYQLTDSEFTNGKVENERTREGIIDSYGERQAQSGDAAVQGSGGSQASTTVWLKAENLGFRFASLGGNVLMDKRGTATISMATDGALDNKQGQELYFYEYEWFQVGADGQPATSMGKGTLFDPNDPKVALTYPVYDRADCGFQLDVDVTGWGDGESHQYYLVVTNTTSDGMSKTLGLPDSDSYWPITVTYDPEYSDAGPWYWKADADGLAVPADASDYLWSADGFILREAIFTGNAVDDCEFTSAWSSFAGEALELQGDNYWEPYLDKTDADDPSKPAYTGTLTLGFNMDQYLGEGSDSIKAKVAAAVAALGADPSAAAVNEAIVQVLEDERVYLLWRDTKATGRPIDYASNKLDIAYAMDGDRVVAKIKVPSGMDNVFGQFAVAFGKTAPPNPDDPASVTYTFTSSLEAQSAAGVKLSGDQLNAVMGDDLRVTGGNPGATYTFVPNISADPAFYVDKVQVLVNKGTTPLDLTGKNIALSTNQISFGTLDLEMFGLDPETYDDNKVAVEVHVVFKQKAATPAGQPDTVRVHLSKAGEPEGANGSEVQVLVDGQAVAPETDSSYLVPKDGGFQLFFSTIAPGYTVDRVQMKTTDPKGAAVDDSLAPQGFYLPVSGYAADVDLTVMYKVGSSSGENNGPGSEDADEYTLTVRQASGSGEAALTAGVADPADGTKLKGADNVTLNMAPKGGYKLTGAVVTLGSGAGAQTRTYDATAAAAISLVNVSSDVKAVYSFERERYAIDVTVGNASALNGNVVSETGIGGRVSAQVPAVEDGQAYIEGGQNLIVSAVPKTEDGFTVKSITLWGDGGSMTLPVGDAPYRYTVSLEDLVKNGVLNPEASSPHGIRVEYEFARESKPGVNEFVISTAVSPESAGYPDSGSITPTSTVKKENGTASKLVHFFPKKVSDTDFYVVDKVMVDDVDATSDDAKRFYDVSAVELDVAKPYVRFDDLTADHRVVVTFRKGVPGVDTPPAESATIGGDKEGGGSGTVTGGGQEPGGNGVSGDTPVWKDDDPTENNTWGVNPDDKNPDGTGNQVDQVKVAIDDDVYTIYEFDHGKPATGEHFDPADYVKDVPGFARVERPEGVFTYTNPTRGIEFIFDSNDMTVTFTKMGDADVLRPIFGIEKTRKVTVRVAPGYGSGTVTYDKQFEWFVGVGDTGNLVFVILPDEGSDLASVEMDPDIEFGIEDRTELGPSAEGQKVLEHGGKDVVRAAARTPQTAETRDLMAVLTGAGTAWADEAAAQKLYEVNVDGRTMDALDRDLLVTVNLKSLKKVTLTATVAGGKGSIQGESTVTVGIGQSHTFRFEPENGYVVSAVQVSDGKQQGWTADHYTFQRPEKDETLKVWFSPKPYAGSNTAASKAVRQLRKLASTGDLNAPAMTLLLALACGALGVALMAGGRRRREEAYEGGDPDGPAGPSHGAHVLMPEVQPEPEPAHGPAPVSRFAAKEPETAEPKAPCAQGTDCDGGGEAPFKSFGMKEE